MPILRSTIFALCCCPVLAMVGPGPAQAMCGGNILVTCPAPAQSAAAAAAKTKREKRLAAVGAKKRRYPLGRR